jgi:hypothetical protein
MGLTTDSLQATSGVMRSQRITPDPEAVSKHLLRNDYYEITKQPATNYERGCSELSKILQTHTLRDIYSPTPPPR